MVNKSFILSCLLAASTAFAQKTHTVAKGDNPYNISKKYGMSLEEFNKMNPSVKDGNLQIGQVIKVKGSATTAVTPKPQTTAVSNSGKLGKIVLKPKQTLYGITKQYKISEADLRKLNPNLDNLTKIGDEIVLPLDAIKKYGDGDSVPVATTTTTEKPATAITEVPNSENTYIVQEKDNYFRISKKFDLTQKQLLELNPGLEEKGLRPGDVITVKGNLLSVPKDMKSIITEKSADTSTKTSVSNDDFVTYTVQSGDTVFGILNKFGITLDDLMSLNPSLSNGLKSGMVLKIKKLDDAYVKKSGDALNIVLMLPFGFDSNDTKYRSLASDFLAGAKLAIERNAKSGLKMDVKVIDAGSESSFKNALIQINPNNTDLIIGPFFKSNVLDVLDFVKKDKIPVVAPFANSDDLYDFSNLIIVETNDQFYADRIIKEVKDTFSDQKIYIVADEAKTNANYLKSGLEKQLKNANITIVNSPSEIKLDQNMMTGQSAPVIAILASDKDALGDAFGNKVIELGKEVQGVKAFSMYFAPIFEKKIDDLSQVSLVYLMDRKINNDGSFEKEVLANFKQKYCKTPSKYNVIGFDVVNDMLSRENKKGEIFRQMGKPQTQLATKFEFERIKSNGAFVNKGYRVVRLMP